MTSSPNTLEDGVGRVGKPTWLSSTTEAQEGLRPTGFDPSRWQDSKFMRLCLTASMVAAVIRFSDGLGGNAFHQPWWGNVLTVCFVAFAVRIGWWDLRVLERRDGADS